MRKPFLFALVVGIACAVAAPLRAAETPEDAAERASASWLALVDAGKYGESW